MAPISILGKTLLANSRILYARCNERLFIILKTDKMGNTLASLGFNQPFFFTLIGYKLLWRDFKFLARLFCRIIFLLMATVSIASTSDTDDEARDIVDPFLSAYVRSSTRASLRANIDCMRIAANTTKMLSDF